MAGLKRNITALGEKYAPKMGHPHWRRLSDMLGLWNGEAISMRKSIVSPSAVAAPLISEVWRDLERIARVEISSEDEQFPIEHALGKKETTGWRAAQTGPQLIRLQFDEPQNIKRLRLRFVERGAERTQEFAVLAGTGSELKEIVRQQWTFSPYGST